MLHTLDGPCYAKNEKYMKNHYYNHVFHVFLIFLVAKVHQKYAAWVLLR